MFDLANNSAELINSNYNLFGRREELSLLVRTHRVVRHIGGVLPYVLKIHIYARVGVAQGDRSRKRQKFRGSIRAPNLIFTLQVLACI